MCVADLAWGYYVIQHTTLVYFSVSVEREEEYI